MGYTHCECRDCFEITIDGGMCEACETAGCEADSECQAPHAYCDAGGDYGKDHDRCQACGEAW